MPPLGSPTVICLLCSNVIRCHSLSSCCFLGKTQKLLNRFSQNLVERRHIGPGRNHYIFGDNPSHVMLGLALEQVGGYLQGVEHWVCRWRPSHNPLHWVCFIRHLFNINNFAGSAALAEVCALLSAILVIREKHSTINYCGHEWCQRLLYPRPLAAICILGRRDLELEMGTEGFKYSWN